MKQLLTPLILLLLLLLSACHTTRHTTDATSTLQTAIDSTHWSSISNTQSSLHITQSDSSQQDIAITTYHLSPPDSAGQQYTTQISHINLSTTHQSQNKQIHHTQNNLAQQTTQLSEAVIIGQKATTNTQKTDNTNSLRTILTLIAIILAITICFVMK